MAGGMNALLGTGEGRNRVEGWEGRTGAHGAVDGGHGVAVSLGVVHHVDVVLAGDDARLERLQKKEEEENRKGFFFVSGL